ncbi:MAG TPA: CvpA family protein [Candidatus Mucispirillum faecigallinarum]|uniref:CvpA family protein n=1 Tax=Candidatus Mucispirillum faecigallinarum TaxID=2838699 RepID=A0A9D2GTQ4_9BACT|nr:CvpA family protein [Candidatus Mucispirillum faecigallinarum]
MGVVDVIIIVFILVFAFKGTINGFITEAISVLGIILAILCSYMLYDPLFKVMKAVGFGDNGASIAAYILGFLIVYVIVIILGNLIHRTLQIIHLGWVNKVLGFSFGILKGAFIASVILWIIVSVLPNKVKFVQDIKGAQSAQAVMKVLPYCYDRLNAVSNIDKFNPFK